MKNKLLEISINLTYNCRIVIKLDSSEKLAKTEVRVPETTEKLQRECKEFAKCAFYARLHRMHE